MKPLIIEEIGDKLVGLPTDEALRVIEEYFSQITWSLEKEEWNRMSDNAKRLFAECAARTTE